ncbi:MULTISPECIES: MFS transporter [Aerosakkonema]|uniref:MFS transporter n=1 Tax=Aerosakkonema TaxID=1246629 RepID=UPI0035BB03F6
MVTNTSSHPLRQPLFRSLWVASVASNIGTWMQNVGGVWLMTTLTPSPLMVALMQTATSLPVFIVGLPAGALADIIDRRRLLLFWQAWMLVAALLLGVLTLFHAITPWLLLALTFALGLGAAMNAPAWQAIVPELVSRPQLPTAITLNGVGFNVARAVGPALGGIVVAAAGAGVVFLLNAASFLGVMAVIYSWKRSQTKSALPAERTIGAIRAGLRYLKYAPVLRAVLLRTGVFIICGSALWALLPLVAKQELGLGSLGYGVLLGCIGLGAITGAFVLPKVRRKVSTDVLIVAGTVVFALATLALAYLRNLGLLYLALVAGGLAWIGIMSSLNAATQLAVPTWVQARSLSLYQLVFQGGIATGSAFWGLAAERWGNSTALSGAAIGLVIGLVAAVPYRLVTSEKLDLTPSLHWPEPVVAIELNPEQGPVLITIEYRIDTARSQEFAKAMHALSRLRRRDGAIRWGLWEDTADPSRYVETYVVESWAEHLRQHERFTVADRTEEARVRAFHIGDKPPIVSHLIYTGQTESV